MKEKVALFFLVFTLLLALGVFGVYTFSQSSSLMLEAEQHWETYGVGGTCIHGSHNLFVVDADSDGVCAWNVGTGDLDNDGTVEIVTVGCMGMNNLCDPDMRIWSIATPLPIEFIIALVASVAFLVMASAYFFAKRSRK